MAVDNPPPQRWSQCVALLWVAVSSAAFAHQEARGSMEPSHLISGYKVKTWVCSLAEPFVRSLVPCIILLCTNVQSSVSEFSVWGSRVMI